MLAARLGTWQKLSSKTFEFFYEALIKRRESQFHTEIYFFGFKVGGRLLACEQKSGVMTTMLNSGMSPATISSVTY